MKKAVMIIALNQFREEELFQPKEILENSGVEVQVASTALSLATGVAGKTYMPQLLLEDIKVSDFDAVIFVGGGGATQYWADPLAHKLARESYESGKIVAAICVAPVVLAKAGILKGKKATVWSSDAGQLLVAGAKYSRENVVKDGNIITASGPFAAREFGEELVKAILH
jgi:protease I